MNKADIQTKSDSDAQQKSAPKGWQIFLGLLVGVVFWGTFVYAIWVRNMELVMIFANIIAIGAGVFGLIHFLSKLREHFSKS